RVGRLWGLEGATLVTSAYAIEEARRNLRWPAQRKRLERRVAGLGEVLATVPDRPLPRGVALPEKDCPILLAALHARATHLLTGDVTHFGRFLGREIEGLRILTPGRYLAEA
ncbi:MAG: hypothetical protein ACE5HP_12550, partial [Gemmatimonadota bacterium]